MRARTPAPAPAPRVPVVGHPTSPSGQRSAPRPPPVTAPALRRWRRRVPGGAALLVAFAGLLDLVSVFNPTLDQRVRRIATIVPGTLTHAAAAATVATGLLLLLLAKALRRRKRRAWRAVVVLLAASVVLHLVKGFDRGEAVPSALVLVALLLLRAEFFAKGDPRTRWSALGVLVLLGAVSFGLGLALLHADQAGLAGPHPFSWQLAQVGEGLIGVTGPLTFHSDKFYDLVYDVLATLGLVTALTTAYLVLRPAEPRCALGAEDEARVRELLCRHGRRDSLGYFALRRDKSVLWSPTGKACVAYRVVSGVM
ncbi:MAG: hypothetical protein ACYDB7_12365, partial [Mycobacteriales bacterium]